LSTKLFNDEFWLSDAPTADDDDKE
jgi:hypothetical protein